ncbi:DUF3558 domain-containing protein [Umezawaea sp. Da 62-37]|uniref:DUF3558 domain-containing protein n=1 Tax=Umezawaea sp. Da 62-37 TaxID=3075927 RepID=UPI0028F71302|nr:DUF3558 domain-containing protein [Umezawaea sp. Da 62-37]WNV91231.1 DUF3558 domain-containing protein [Umezawaea sp. Da 62-37]
MSTFRSGFALLAAALVLAGCTSEVGGSAGSDTTEKAPGTSSPPPTTSKKAPQPVRPKVIKIDTIDPCRVFADDQVKQLGVTPGKRQDADLVEKGKAPGCVYLASGSFTYQVVLIPNQGIDYWREGSGNVDRKETQVSGFDAVQTNLIGQSDQCSFWIDVSDGQLVYVNYLPIKTMKLDQVCGNAQKGAELALATLTTLA